MEKVMSVEDRISKVLLRKAKEKTFNYKSIKELKGKHTGKDIYVVGGGKSMDYISPSFFDNKIVVGVNYVYKKYRCDYLVKIHGLGNEEAINGGQTVVTSKLDCGFGNNLNLVDTDKKYYVFETRKNQGLHLSTSDLDTESELVVGASTLSSAVHFSYFLGASNIILCGCDCGEVDGESYYESYYDTEKDYVEALEGIERGFFGLNGSQTKLLADKIRETGVNVLSINPFINLGLEGHSYK